MGDGKAREKQEELFYASEVVRPAAHPFYEALNGVLQQAGFDRFCEELCRKFYHEKLGRPSLAPGVYFRCLLIGFFEGIGGERGIAWRIADSLSLRRFLHYGLDEATPDHVTISRTRRLLEEKTHQAVFEFVLREVARRGLLKGKTMGVDATRWRPMRRCAQLCGARRARVIWRMYASWRKKRASIPTTMRRCGVWTASARRKCPMKIG